MLYSSLVVLIAGSSTRFNMKGIKKQFLIVDDKPVFIHTLQNLTKSNIFQNVIIVCQKEYLNDVDKYIKEYCKNIENISIVLGGDTRVDSVYNAMKYLKNDYKVDYVFIHDGVRPIVAESEINMLMDKVINHDAAILAIKINDTIKKIDSNNKIVETLNREILYRAATPQAFLFTKYYNAIDKYINIDKSSIAVTDDAEIYARYEGDVYIVQCSSKNIKITTEDDMHLLF